MYELKKCLKTEESDKKCQVKNDLIYEQFKNKEKQQIFVVNLKVSCGVIIVVGPHFVCNGQSITVSDLRPLTSVLEASS